MPDEPVMSRMFYEHSPMWHSYTNQRAGSKAPARKPSPPKQLRAMRSVNRNR